MNTTTKTAPKKLKAPASKVAAKAGKPATVAAPKAEKVAKPTVPVHSFESGYTGASGPLNARPSKTPIDFGKFGSLADKALTDRDRESIAAIRAEFQGKQFSRSNVDAGILRRLGERGYLAHVAGSDVSPLATFKLTSKAMAV